ncbi:MAG: MauE/DoxX family redox-associated membrane protein [Planctomycetota bacterium]|jgi:uncharacterized membrane protein YphA (DoxX/SURF4 family)
MERALAILVLRWISGLIWFMAGWFKCFTLGPAEHARMFFVEPYAQDWMPAWLLWATGASVPIVELLGGAMLLLGWRVRGALVALGAVLVLVTYGHLLHEPLFDITGHIFPRTAMLVALLLLPRRDDRFSLDGRVGAHAAAD